MKKTTAALALTALAVPGAAYADKPENAGTKNAAERQERNTERQKQRTKTRTKGVGFVVKGLVTEGSVPTLEKDGTDSRSPFTFGGPLTLDVTSANKHARTALELTREEIRGTTGLPLDDITGDDSFRLRLEGVTGDSAGLPTDLKAGDRVVLIGKVERTRSKSTNKRTARASSHGERSGERTKRVSYTYGEVDLRKVVLSRPGAETEGDDS